MEEYKYCTECGCNVTELHYIILRSKASYMANIKVNFKYLCPEHHRGNAGPHHNRDKDLEYKLQLQKDMFSLFEDKDYWTDIEIKDKLKCTSSEVKKITKKLRLYKEGYDKFQLIQRLMGGMLYGN